MPETLMKICSKCHINKALTDYSKDASKGDGLQCSCKECCVKIAKVNRENNDKNRATGNTVVASFKMCPGCRATKIASLFSKSNGSTDGLGGYCKSCTAIRKMEKKYKITKEWRQATLDAQGSACAICRTKNPGGRGTWHVDHIHGTEIVRGILHCDCNLGLGFFKDNVSLMSKTIEYLRGPDLGIRYSRKLAKSIKDVILASQNYLCKICSVDLRTTKADLDHDHSTMMVRGYLCHSCNCGLGKFKDSIPLLQSAIAYLNKYSSLEVSSLVALLPS